MKDNTTIDQLLDRNFARTHAGVLGMTEADFYRPERVLQFGTGVLLRGLVDYVIDGANKAGLFDGSVVVVKSTDSPLAGFAGQDNLYTLVEQGVQAGEIMDKKHLVSCISRVLTTRSQWDKILQCAADPAIDVVVSNTTEAGLVYVEELFDERAPKTFPGKLAAYLWRRYEVFNGDPNKGMVILPCELRRGNGRLLEAFVLEHARHNDLPGQFLAWLRKSNVFCNTLVDRIVPGTTADRDLIEWDSDLQYIDRLHVRVEPYLLWAIEGNEDLVRRLPFTRVDSRVIISEDIAGYEEQKIRILNGSNTAVALAAFLAGCDTILDTVSDPLFAAFTRQVIDNEILPVITDECPHAAVFANETLDRFRNPYVQYKLLNIALQCSSKINSRNADTIVRYYNRFQRYPPLTIVGLASFFIFYTPMGRRDGAYFGLRNNEPYFYRDDHAEWICGVLEDVDWSDSRQATDAVSKILGNGAIFSKELASVPGLARTVAEHGLALCRAGIRITINQYLEDTK
jgi:tagaturonate reductase